LYKQLLADGIDPWLDEENLLPGQDWALEITKALRASDLIIVCLSRGSVTKEGFIQKEIRQALDVADEKPEETIFLIPLRLEQCEVPERLRKWQWVDLFEKDGYQRLLRSLDSRASAVHAKNLRTTKHFDSSPSLPKEPSRRERILQVMDDSVNRSLWIKGVSLNAFFREPAFYEAIYRACRREVDVKVLLVDPDSEQARMRAYLEYEQPYPSSRIEDFTSEEMKRTRLYHDMMATIGKIRQLSAELNAMGLGHTFEARLFSSAVEAFMLISDQAALVEQYHYGKVRGSYEGPLILSREMPLIEYGRAGREPAGDPYRILKDHFEFVFAHYSKRVQDWLVDDAGLKGGRPLANASAPISWKELEEFRRRAIDPMPLGPVMRGEMNRGLSDELLCSRLKERISRGAPVYLLLLEYERRLHERGIMPPSVG
jgi:hypothetical protein